MVPATMRPPGAPGQLFWLDPGPAAPRQAGAIVRCGKSVKVRRPHFFLLAVLALAVAVSVAVGFRGRRNRPEADRDVLRAAPSDAWLVVKVDMAAASPLVRPLLGPDGRLTRLASTSRVAGLGLLSDACGFEPLEHTRELMVALPEGGERGEFGAAFSGDLTKDALAACALKVIRARGGKPSTLVRGGFAVIRTQANRRSRSWPTARGDRFSSGTAAGSTR